MGKSSIQVRIDSGGWQNLKWAERQVARGLARWVEEGKVLHMIGPDEKPRPAERSVPASPKLMWPAWYQTTEAPKSEHDEVVQALHGVIRHHAEQTTRKGEWYTDDTDPTHPDGVLCHGDPRRTRFHKVNGSASS